MQKKIAVGLLSMTFLSANAFALTAEDLVLTAVNPNDFIHTTQIKTGGRSLDATIVLEVGKGDQNNCEIQKEVINKRMRLGDMEIMLDGVMLARIVGVDHTCVKETYKPVHGPGGSVTYAIFNDGHIYNKAVPNQQEVVLHGE